MVEPSRRRFLGGLAAAAAWRQSGGGSGRPSFPDTVVTATDELHRAFRNLDAGETVWIADDGAPYRTTEWLDIDVDGVTVVGPSVRRLVVPADGANVGGIRIGHGGHCENVEVRGVGYAGNPGGQDPGAKRLHGFVVRDATDVTLEGNSVTRTHPYHEHNSGGSGISVERRARNVRVAGNYVYDIGDRGIQLAGERILVTGNFVVDGFDHSIALDAWVPDERHARNVSVRGNVMGNNPEGALVGASGGRQASNVGYFDVSDNLGFGRHKSLCLVGFGQALRGIQIAGNVSVQTGEDRFAGVSLEIERAEDVTVRDNDLYGYGGPGINVGEGIADFVVSGNGIYDAGAEGIRVSGATDGAVRDNYVDGTGGVGVALDAARRVTVRGNRLDRVGGAGVVSRNADGPARHEVVGNYLRSFGTAAGDSTPPGFLVADSGLTVGWNRILRDGAPAIVERPDAGRNRYVDNRADGDGPDLWQIRSPTSAVVDHAPPVDAHRGLSVDGEGSTVRVEFEKPYAEPPQLTFGRRGGGIRDVEYTTDGDGNVDGARITVAGGTGVLDAFVDPA
ncbi:MULTISPECIES: right-handed parallel beta-helix repeat-containing protein [Halorussus]|uniref:right-handed parallel beta-helix repeat-containing protein n=1 Tax=Halorussus TaxID=1070314 RepID=UPI00209E482C|nr:right-handed parallel beta-helix repeat-containing protein [Halorussus vallis]USZ77178.1 right-handed parallel beta-helix repeat-containing protein [Halorussus vallis]